MQTKFNDVERTLHNEREQFKSETSRLQQEIDTLTARLKPLREEVSLLTSIITTGVKFDPIGIAGATFDQGKGQSQLAYHILLVQENAKRPVYNGRLEVTFEGRYPNGRAGAIKALVQPFNLGHYEHIMGEVEMPNGFIAQRATLRLYQGDSQRALTFRTFNVSE